MTWKLWLTVCVRFNLKLEDKVKKLSDTHSLIPSIITLSITLKHIEIHLKKHKDVSQILLIGHHNDHGFFILKIKVNQEGAATAAVTFKGQVHRFYTFLSK